MPSFDSLKSVSKSLESQQAPEPEELKNGKKDLIEILGALEAKEKEIESSSDSAEKKAERYAKIAEVLKTQVLPVLQSWPAKYPEKKEGITNAITQIKALIKKYEKKSEELKSQEERAAASEDAAAGLKSDLSEDLENNGFSKDKKGGLHRKGKEGIYKFYKDNGTLTYRDKTGFYLIADAKNPDEMERAVDMGFEKTLPQNLKGYGFFLDHEGKMRRKGFDGVYELQADKSLIFHSKKGPQKLPPKGNPGDETGRYYVNTNEIKDFPKTDWKSIEDQNVQAESFPENLQKENFYRDNEGKLRRKGKGEDGIFEIQKDKSVIYRDKEGVQKLAAGSSTWEKIDDAKLEKALPQNLKNKGFFKDDEGKIRRKGFKGEYTIKDGELHFKNKETTQVLPAGADIDDPKKWQVLSQKSAQNPADIDLAKEKAPGFAQLYEASETQILLDQYSNEQKLEMLEEISKNVEISEAQRKRILQAGMIKTAFESIKTGIRDSRTLVEDLNQYLEPKSRTEARLAYVESLTGAVDGLEEKIRENPDMTMDQLLDPRVKQLLNEFSISKGGIGGATGLTYKETLAALISNTGQIKEARTEEELKRQYLALMEFLRYQSDYATAQTLAEKTLLAPYFEQKRAEFDKEVKANIHKRIDEKVRKSITPEIKADWTKQGMTGQQQSEYIEELIDQEEKRELNKRIIELRNENPFDVGGTDRLIMESYIDMMGAGEWYDMADETWDTIQKELITNAPLIIISGALGNLAKAGLSAGARALVSAGKFAKIGLEIGEAGGAIVATGLRAKTLYWAGKGVGLLAEGAVFETAHSALQGENLFAGDFPEWASRILWSSATLGAFHLSGAKAKKVKEIITRNISKISDKAIAAVAAKLLAEGTGKSIEAATMLMIGAVQHGVMAGNFEDWDLLDQVLHSCIVVGALTVAGAGSRHIIAGAKKFLPTGPERPAGTVGSKSKEEIELENKYKGKEVSVERTETGEIDSEGGWVFEGTLGERVYLVKKDADGKVVATKKPKVEEFKKWQEKEVKAEEPPKSEESKPETPEARTNRAKSHIGEDVFVERSDGTIEGGWVVKAVTKGDTLVLTKDTGLTKHVKLDKFEATQAKAAKPPTQPAPAATDGFFSKSKKKIADFKATAGKAAKAAKEALKPAQVNKAKQAAKLSKKADKLFKKKKYAEAETILREAIKLDPANARYQNDLGIALYRQGKFAEAEVACKEAIKLDPTNAEYKNGLGHVLYEQGRYAETEVVLKEAIKLDPTNAGYRNNLGHLLYAQGKYAEAEARYREAIKLDPTNDNYREGLEEVLEEVRSKGKDREEQLDRQYKGKPVSVKRTSGQVESGWTVDGVMGEKVYLSKKDPNEGVTRKEATVAEFEGWQKEAERQAKSEERVRRELFGEEPANGPKPEPKPEAEFKAAETTQKYEPLPTTSVEIAALREKVAKKVVLNDTDYAAMDKAGMKYVKLGFTTGASKFIETGALVQSPENPDIWHVVFSKRSVDAPDKVLSKKVSDLLGGEDVYVGNPSEFAKALTGKSLEVMKPEAFKSREGGREVLLDVLMDNKTLRVKAIKSATSEGIAKAEAEIEADIAREAEAKKRALTEKITTGKTREIESLTEAEATEVVEKFTGDHLVLGTMSINEGVARELAKFKGSKISLKFIEHLDEASAKELAAFKGEIEFEEVVLTRESQAIWEKAKEAAAKTQGKTGQLPIAEKLRGDYHMVRDFHEGLAAVGKSSGGKTKWGFINEQGKEVIPSKYDVVRDFRNGLAAVGKSSGGETKWGFVNEQGQEVIPPQYDSAFSFQKSRKGMQPELEAEVRLGDKRFFIDQKGDRVIQPETRYEYFEYFKEDRALVKKGGKYGFINERGEEVIPPQYDQASQFNSGLALVTKEDGGHSYIDREGKEVIKIAPKYHYLRDFSEGLAHIGDANQKFGYIDTKGNEVIGLEYDNADGFLKGRARVMKDGESFYIDKKGNRIADGVIPDPKRYEGSLQPGNFSENLVHPKNYGLEDGFSWENEAEGIQSGTMMTEAGGSIKWRIRPISKTEIELELIPLPGLRVNEIPGEGDFMGIRDSKGNSGSGIGRQVRRTTKPAKWKFDYTEEKLGSGKLYFLTNNRGMDGWPIGRILASDPIQKGEVEIDTD